MDFHRFLKSFFDSSPYRIYQLAGDASNRRYYRVIKENQSWVLMVWEPFEATSYPFLSVQSHFLKNKVRVPQVIKISPEEGLVLLEDLGDLTLERRFWESQSEEASWSFYQKAIEELIKIHFVSTLDRSDCSAFKIQFDTEKFLWEMNYGLDNLIKGILQFELSETQSKELQNSFLDICQKLDHEPKWISHRDYHSRNLMIKFDDLRVIDFQDARLGPIQYDLVSLLRDSYVNLSEDFGDRALNYYLQLAEPFLKKSTASGFSHGHFQKIYEIQSIQRCFKACGSFSSFYFQRQDTRYLKYISGTLKKVLKSLIQFPEYKVFSDVLMESGALDKNYETL